MSSTEQVSTWPALRSWAREALVGDSSTPVTVPWRFSSIMLRPLPQPASRIRARGGSSTPHSTPSITVTVTY
jgi:hypothetical protein